MNMIVNTELKEMKKQMKRMKHMSYSETNRKQPSETKQKMVK